MLLDNGQYNAVWDRVDRELHFRPSVHKWVVPFRLREPYVVYDIREWKAASEDSITNAFINCTAPGERLYALDWQHSGFLFDPRNPQHDGTYHAVFPPYYPDGDYYFFIDEQFRFGYLSHPWREEVWIFGSSLIAEFERIYRQLGWTVKEVAPNDYWN